MYQISIEYHYQRLDVSIVEETFIPVCWSHEGIFIGVKIWMCIKYERTISIVNSKSQHDPAAHKQCGEEEADLYNLGVDGQRC